MTFSGVLIAPTLNVMMTGKERVATDLVQHFPIDLGSLQVMSPEIGSKARTWGYPAREYIYAKKLRRLGATHALFSYGTGFKPGDPQTVYGSLVHDLFFGSARHGRSGVQLAGNIYRSLTIPRLARSAHFLVCLNDEVHAFLRSVNASAPVIRYAPGVSDAWAASAPPADRAVEPYILVVTGPSERKNGVRQVRAALRVARQTDLQVVVLGWPAARWEFPDQEASRLQVLHRPASEDDYRRLLVGAAMLVTCSLHEGWGLPALEGLALGVKTTTALTPSIMDLRRRTVTLPGVGVVQSPADEEELVDVMLQTLVGPIPDVSSDDLSASTRVRELWSAIAETS